MTLLANLLVGDKLRQDQKDVVEKALNKLYQVEYIKSDKEGSSLIDEVLEEIEKCTY